MARKGEAADASGGGELGNCCLKGGLDLLHGSVSKNQGLFVKFDDGSRIVVRLSGTGSSGATIRLYVERHETDQKTFNMDAQDYLKENVQLATELLKLKEYIGRTVSPQL